MRTYDESCALLDRVVGRCVRDAAFAASVLEDPESALAEYELNEDELDDFRSLKARHREEAAEAWHAIRSGMTAIQAGHAHQARQIRKTPYLGPT
jgi:hypothetical protein